VATGLALFVGVDAFEYGYRIPSGHLVSAAQESLRQFARTDPAHRAGRQEIDDSVP
jgi:hypothetical protein